MRITTPHDVSRLMDRDYHEAHDIANAAGENKEGCFIAARWMAFHAWEHIQKVPVGYREGDGVTEPPAQPENNPDSDFCSHCREHTDFEQDEKGEWLSVCCSARVEEME